MFLFKRRGYYHVEFYDTNEDKVKRISTKTKVKSEALNFITQLKEKVKDSKRVKVLSLIEFIEEYQNFIEVGLSKKYLQSVKLSFKMLNNYTGDIYLNDLTMRKLEAFINHTFIRSKFAAHLYYRTIKAGLSKAVSWGYLTENPAKKIKVPKIPKKLPIIFIENEFNCILDSTDKIELQEIFIFAAFSGMRLNEILNLRWVDVDSI